MKFETAKAQNVRARSHLTSWELCMMQNAFHTISTPRITPLCLLVINCNIITALIGCLAKWMRNRDILKHAQSQGENRSRARPPLSLHLHTALFLEEGRQPHVGPVSSITLRNGNVQCMLGWAPEVSFLLVSATIMPGDWTHYFPSSCLMSFSAKELAVTNSLKTVLVADLLFWMKSCEKHGASILVQTRGRVPTLETHGKHWNIVGPF